MIKHLYLQSVSRDLLNSALRLAPKSILVEVEDLPSCVATLKDLSSNVELGVVLNVFNGDRKAYFDSSVLPVESSGRDVSTLWYKPVCPNNPAFRDRIIQEFKGLCNNSHLTTIWLDFLYFPNNWNLAEHDFFDICYCSNCIQSFNKSLGGEDLPKSLDKLAEVIDGMYYPEWLEFKANSITSLVKEFAVEAKASGKRLGIFCIPWGDKDLGSAIVRVFGQNFSELEGLVDFFSPMVFLSTHGKNLAFVNDTLEYFKTYSPKLIPALFYSKENTDEFTGVDVLNATKASGIDSVLIYNLAEIVTDAKITESLS